MAKLPVEVKMGQKQGRWAYVLVDADGKTFGKWFFRQEKAEKRAEQMNRGFAGAAKPRPRPKPPDLKPGELRLGDLMRKLEAAGLGKPERKSKPKPKPRPKTPRPETSPRKRRAIAAAEKRLRGMRTAEIEAVGGRFSARGLVQRLQEWAEGIVPDEAMPLRMRAAPFPRPANLTPYPMYAGSGKGLELRGKTKFGGINTLNRKKLWGWIEDIIGKGAAMQGWQGGVDREWAKDRLGRLGFDLGPVLGRGHFGVAYDLYIPGTKNPSGYVVKFTVDPSEIATAIRVKDLNESAFPIILGAWEMPNGNWMLVREGLFSLKAAFGDSPQHEWMCSLRVTEDVYGTDRDGKPLKGLWKESRDERLAIAKAVAPKASWKMYDDFAKSLKRAYKKHGVVIMDLHCNNVRVRALPSGKLQFVASDLGVSGGAGVVVPMAENNPFWG